MVGPENQLLALAEDCARLISSIRLSHRIVSLKYDISLDNTFVENHD